MAGMTRRAFATGATLCAAAAAGASLPSGMALASEGSTSGDGGTARFDFHEPVAGEVAFEEAPVPEEAISQRVECDVVIAGAGLAGVSAALSAVQQGLSVMVFEKGGVASGRGAQLGAIGSKVQNEAGTEEIDKAEFVDDAMASMGYKADRKIWERYAENCGQAADWLIESLDGACGDWRADNVATVVNSGVKSWADTIQPSEGMAKVAPAALDKAVELGAQVMFNTPVVQLVNEGGAVTGAIARGADGEYILANASRGVVLATGGYEDNWEMLSKSVAPRDLAVATWRNPSLTNTGDGHMMGLAVGAGIDDYPHAMMNDPGGSVGSHTFCRPLAQPFLRVNEQGRRFVNEALSPEFVAAAIAMQPGAHDWVIIAGDLEENISETLTKRGLPFPVADMVSAFEKEAVKAASIEELAEACGIDPQGLEETVNAYDSYYDAQEDPQFGKSPTCLLPVREGPYYACEEGPAALVTVSGLTINEHSEVISVEGEPIPGLYALGNVSGRMFDSYYPHHLQANSHGRCVTFGYLLGIALAQK
jgi:fumarate reductase flavoprotein subunit